MFAVLKGDKADDDKSSNRHHYVHKVLVLLNAVLLFELGRISTNLGSLVLPSVQVTVNVDESGRNMEYGEHGHNWSASASFSSGPEVHASVVSHSRDNASDNLRPSVASAESLTALHAVTPEGASLVATDVSLSDTPELINNTKTTSEYAYAFMYWGMNPDVTVSYRYALTHFMLSARLLRGPYNSTADVIAVLKMSPAYASNRLPEDDEAMLRSEGIYVHYISDTDPENTEIPCFNLSRANGYQSMMHKFYLYRLTQYRRIFYLDADVMLHRNLDYWMEYSDQGIFGEQVLLAGYTEAANGGTFVLTPSYEAWREVRTLMIDRGLVSDRSWNRTRGWGHVIQPPDYWTCNHKTSNGTEWSFFAASVDQGLLYHFCKYGRRNCTHILSREVYDFRPSKVHPGETITTLRPWSQTVLANITLDRAFPFVVTPGSCNKFSQGRCVVPYTDITHWTGSNKPWKQSFPANPLEVRTRIPGSAKSLWWHMFFTLMYEHEEAHPESRWFRDILPKDVAETVNLKTQR